MFPLVNGRYTDVLTRRRPEISRAQEEEEEEEDEEEEEEEEGGGEVEEEEETIYIFEIN